MKRFVLPTIILLALFLAGCSAGGESVTMISQMKVLNGSIYNITNNITQNFSVNITTVYNSSVANQSVACSDANSYIYNSSWVDGVQSILCASDTDTDTFNTSAEMITATNGRLNSAGGWTNTTTTTNTNLAVIIGNNASITGPLMIGGASGFLASSYGIDNAKGYTATSGTMYWRTVDVNLYADSGKNFYFRSTGAPTNKIGILTSSPSHTLSVNGSANISQTTYMNISQMAQGILSSGLSGNSVVGLAGAVLVANNSTGLYPGLRVNGQSGAVFNEGTTSQHLSLSQILLNESYSIVMNVTLYNYDNRHSYFGDYTTNSGYFLGLSESAYSFEPSNIDGKGCSWVGENITAGTNHIVGFIVNITHVSLYVDGSFQSSCVPTDNITFMNLSLFGRGYTAIGASYFNGTIENILVYNRTLNSSEMSGVGGGCAAAPATGLVLCYDLNKSPDIHEVYGNSTHVKDVSYLPKDEYYHLCYDDSGVLIKGCGAG